MGRRPVSFTTLIPILLWVEPGVTMKQWTSLERERKKGLRSVGASMALCTLHIEEKSITAKLMIASNLTL